MKWKIKDENKGFTLVELILSVVILAFVVAPFLSSFVVAHKSNTSSKRKQEATDIGQLLAEEFKATDFRRLTGAIEDGGYPFENYAIALADGSESGEIGYRFTLDNDMLPNAYSDAYHAEITLEPSNSDVNDKVTPVINSADSESMVVYLANIYAHDGEALTMGATKRKCTIRIRSEYSPDMELIYYVKLFIEYLNDNDTVVLDVSTEFGELEYDKSIPEVYLVYTPMSDSDEVVIDNTIIPIILRDEDDNQQRVNVYLAMQNINEFDVLDPWKVSILSTDDDGNTGIVTSLGKMQEEAFLSGNYVYNTETTSLHTNVADERNLVDMMEKDTLYNMKVTVYYNEDVVATINSAKNILDKGEEE